MRDIVILSRHFTPCNRSRCWGFSIAADQSAKLRGLPAVVVTSPAVLLSRVVRTPHEQGRGGRFFSSSCGLGAEFYPCLNSIVRCWRRSIAWTQCCLAGRWNSNWRAIGKPGNRQWPFVGTQSRVGSGSSSSGKCGRSAKVSPFSRKGGETCEDSFKFASCVARSGISSNVPKTRKTVSPSKLSAVRSRRLPGHAGSTAATGCVQPVPVTFPTMSVRKPRFRSDTPGQVRSGLLLDRLTSALETRSAFCGASEVRNGGTVLGAVGVSLPRPHGSGQGGERFFLLPLMVI